MRRLEALLALVLVATVVGAWWASRLPEAHLAEVPEVVLAPEPAAENDESALVRRLWKRIARVRDEGAVCGRRPLPPVGELRSVPALVEVAHAGLAEPALPLDERLSAAKYRAAVVGELVARGPRTADEVVEGWLADPERCAVLLAPGAIRGGAAVAALPEGGFAWSVVLGAR